MNMITNYATSGLLAHGLTRGTRILVRVNDTDRAGQTELISLGRKGTDDLTDRVVGTSCTGKRMRIFLAGGGMIYCGVNEPAVVIL